MIFDMHVHQNRHSSDSRLDIYEGVEYAKSLGLDGICVTDHDNLGLKSLAAELTKNSGIHVIVGVEIYTLDGDLLCYGIDEMPEKRMSAQETIDYVNARGGVCVAAHPFRDNRRGLEEVLYQVNGLAALEGYNGRTKPEDNFKSISTADSLALPICGGSDAHTVEEIGNFVTVFEDAITSEADLIAALRSGRFSAGVIKGRAVSREEIA
ncbi:MAG: PHP domain-containing protein [Clostridia bacterium]|nr:PHP domain-containing protein [Clostridia bacterium]